ncbi:MAG: S41 family peptidase [Phycisphaerae bacterium]|nr:S41 family peptidase [Phycisphaerae bacterium]
MRRLHFDRKAVWYRNRAVFLMVLAVLYVFGCGQSDGMAKTYKDANSVVQLNAEQKLVKTACENIYKGDFDRAKELVKNAKPSSELYDLRQVVESYKKIEQARDKERQKAFEEKVAELERIEKTVDLDNIEIVRLETGDVPIENNIEEPAVVDANIPDVNDTNNLTNILSVISQAAEFARPDKKDDFLKRPFVQKVFKKALAEAEQLESEGKWLESYINCYSWLSAIYKDNEKYNEYTDQLLEKAGIAGSFQDSPCESAAERYNGVYKQMFIRAIDALQFGYVKAIDYEQMAKKAIDRSVLLADVMASTSFAQMIKTNAERSFGKNGQSSLSIPDANQLGAWKVAVSRLKDELKDKPMGITKDGFLEVFSKVIELNKATVELPESVVVAQFSEAALSALDPYTVMVWPKQIEDFEQMMTNEFTGIGVEISKEKGFLTAMSLLPDTPAYRSGLDAGDVIEAVDGTPTNDMSLACAVKRIKGPAGTKVELAVRTPGQEKSRKITITRAKITVDTIRGWQRSEEGSWNYMIDPASRIGYVRIASFDEKTASGLESVLDRLEKQKMRALILDLRFDPGGLLTSAIDVVDKFVTEGLIVSTRPRFGVWTYASAKAKGTHPDYPMVVLINQSSASASEIVAGALQDKMHKRAVLVGDRTHGKGSVQQITNYTSGGSQLKYTMAYYHLPSGQRVESKETVKEKGRDDWGVGPDVAVKLRSDEYKKMFDVRRDNDVLVKADHDAAAPLKKYTIEDTLDSDPQLAVAILVAKTQLVEREALKN